MKVQEAESGAKNLFPLSRNHVILTYYAHPMQRVLTYQILRPKRVRKVLDGICAYVQCRSVGYSKVVV